MGIRILEGLADPDPSRSAFWMAYQIWICADPHSGRPSRSGFARIPFWKA